MSERSRFQRLIEENHECRSYSGRGMGGNSCLGVDLRSTNLGDFMSDLIMELQSHTNSGDDTEDRALFEEVADAFRSMHVDQMGKGQVVYFESIDFVDPDEDEDTDEESEDDEYDDGSEEETVDD